MAAEQLAEREASLEIDATAGFQFAKAGASKRLGGYVHREPAGAFGNHGQACAVDGDRIADADFGNWQRCVDGNYRALVGRLEAFDGAEIFDDTGEHHFSWDVDGARKNLQKNHIFYADGCAT